MVCQEAEVNLKGRENLGCHKLEGKWIRAKKSFAQYEANLKKSRIFPQGQGTNLVMHRNEDLQNLSKAQILFLILIDCVELGMGSVTCMILLVCPLRQNITSLLRLAQKSCSPGLP